MFGVPMLTPVTIPDVIATEAIPTLLLLHDPPEVGSLAVIVEPTHTLGALNAIADGEGFTVIG
jgi:hypothetical protein